ncbi:hypothetical protein M0R72_11110 [Candidatus Pacearchaeota archaeon]|jgi:hypothetical protein|nr:hypothetical protein [Candidatus Pacearchaeota archaeon]
MKLIFVALLLVVLPASALEMQYVHDLRPTENMTLVGNLKEILGNDSYDKAYQEGVFDCQDSCAITRDVLAKHGYESIAIARLVPKNSSSESHMWLAVPDGAGRYAFVETTIFASGVPALGGVVIPTDVRIMGYDQGYKIASDQIPTRDIWIK